MEYYYFLFFIFALFGYFIVTDESVAKAFYYVTKIVQSEYIKKKWWLIHNPKTPWARYFMWRRSMKLAKELQKEFDKNDKL
jgi:hypothetical protein